MRIRFLIIAMAITFFVAVSCDSSETGRTDNEEVSSETGGTDSANEEIGSEDEELNSEDDEYYEDLSKVAIACHRGYWRSDEAEQAQNSIASLSAAQKYEFWGSEFDIHLCTDNVILVYHDQLIDGKRFDSNPSFAFADITLANGEKIPTFEEYLEQGAKSSRTKLVCELKTHSTQAKEDKLLEVAVAQIKDAGLYDPKRIMFISFSKHICDVIAETMPEFTNQYLNGDISPEALAKDGINGIDYDFNILIEKPEWITEAHELGMSVNTYTVDTVADIEYMLDLGVDCITTNYPDRVRSALEGRGWEER